MLYCEVCRKNWNWPEKNQGPITHCDVCGARGKCYETPASELPLPDHRRLQVLTADELPKEWSDCVRVSAAISTEILDMVKAIAELQEVAKKHNEYIRLVNKLYYGGELGDSESTILVV